MKLTTAILALCSLTLHGKEQRESLDAARALRVVIQIEGSSRDHVSKHGALGIYQLMPATWAQYSKMNPQTALSENPNAKAETERVALAHAQWIISTAMPALGLPATPYSFALIWGPGFGHVAKLNLSPKNVECARRFANLYLDPTF